MVIEIGIITQQPSLKLDNLRSELCLSGLNLCACFSYQTLRESVPDVALPAGTRNLVLIGAAGKNSWQKMPARYHELAHPVDEYSADAVERALATLLPADCWSLVYPLVTTSVSLPLQSLGRLAGWHQPSPLGIGINQQYGVWFAYRAAVALKVDVSRNDSQNESSDTPQPESPCLSCDAPCVSSCPANALHSDVMPDLKACVSYRSVSDSDCASTCLARTACPVAPQWRYSDEQIAYFYKRSLPTLKRWVDSL